MSNTPNPASETETAPVPQVLDLDHLEEQTLGDEALEADLLTLFSRQARNILTDLRDNADAGDGVSRRADLLHLLCGSARAIGAWDVALQAQTLEAEARGSRAGPLDPEKRLPALADAVQRACEAIGRRQAATRR